MDISATIKPILWNNTVFPTLVFCVGKLRISPQLNSMAHTTVRPVVIPLVESTKRNDE